MFDYLRESYLLPTYRAYLTSKFQWQESTLNQIKWQTTDNAMKKLAKLDCIQIGKIIHRWTPTQISPGNYPTQESNKLCPSCHPKPNNQYTYYRQKLKATLTTFCHKNNLDPNWYQMWWLGLTHPNGTPEHGIHLYASQFQPIFQSQQQIGWKQLHVQRKKGRKKESVWILFHHNEV